MSYRSMHPQFKKTFEHYSTPVEMQEGFWNYFAYGIDLGGFGMAILRNDFCEAIVRAHVSLQSDHLRGMAKWFMNVPPREAFGSEENIRNWKAKTDDERRDIMIEYRLRPSVIDILRGVAVA